MGGAYSPSGSGGFCEPLLSLFTDRLDLSLRCIFWDTAAAGGGCLRGCSDVVPEPGGWPPLAPAFGARLAPQVHVCGTLVCSAAPGGELGSPGLCVEVLTEA